MKRQEEISLPPRSGKLLNLYHGAVDRVQALQIRLGEVERELETVKIERDAAVKDISLFCSRCVHGKLLASDPPCDECLMGMRQEHWQWRGVCPENTEVQDETHHHML